MDEPRPTCPDCTTPLPEGVSALLCPVCALIDTPSADEDAITVGDYELGREIARGGMGVVYEAKQKALQRQVALKVLPGAIFSSPEFRQRFQREAETAASLSHPGIVTVYEVGLHQGQPFIAMELIKGPSLAERLQHGRMTPHLAAHIVRQVALAVAHAHEHGVIHRDLKPSNILLRHETEPVLTDFGLARFIHDGRVLTLSSQSLGSPGYIPPERAAGKDSPASVAEDVYGLGAVLYHCLGGRPPFVADTIASILAATQDQEPLAPRLLNSSVPRDLETICLRCLEKMPSGRYATASEVAAELDRYLRGEPVLARPVGAVTRLWKRAKRQPLVAALVAALVLAVGMGFIASALGWQQARAEAERRRVEQYSSQMAAAAAALNLDHPAQARALVNGLLPAEGQTDLRGPEWHVLKSLLQPPERQAISAHSHILTALSWSPDGQYLASGAHHGSVKVWRLIDNQKLVLIRELVAPGQPRLHQLEWASNDTLLSAEEASVIRCRSALNGKVVWQIPGRQFSWSPQSQTLAVSDAGPFFYEPGGNITLWDWRPGSPPQQRQTPVIKGRAVAISRSGRHLAVGKVRSGGGDAEQGLSLIDLSQPGHADIPLQTSGPVWSLGFSPDSSQLVATLFQGGTSVLRFDAATGSPLPALVGHQLRPWSAVFDQSGDVITTSSDRTLRAWHQQHETARVRAAHDNEVWSIALHPGGKLIATGDKDGILKVFDYPLPAPRLQSLPRWSHRRYENILFAPDSQRILLSPVGQTPSFQALSRADSVSLQLSGSVLGHDAKARLWAWDAREQMLVTPHPALRWQIPSPEQKQGHALKVILPEGGPYAFAIHAPGIVTRVDLFSDQSATIHLPLRTPLAGAAALKAMAASTDGRYLAVATWHQLALHDFATEQTLMLPNDPHWARDIAFSPTGEFFVSAGIDGHIHVHRLPDAEVIQVLDGHLEEASGVAFSPDGRTLVSVEIGLGLKFWRTDTWREVLSLPLADAAESLRFSPDGRWLAVVLCQPGADPDRARTLVLPTGG